MATSYRFCPQCGQPADPGALYCAQCGGACGAQVGVAAPQTAHLAAPSSGGGAAIASLALGVGGILLGCIPILGIPAAAAGLFIGIANLRSPQRGMAIGGIATSSFALLCTLAGIAFWVIGMAMSSAR
jgi:hypothetical protein